jgi:hypothetical protein
MDRLHPRRVIHGHRGADVRYNPHGPDWHKVGDIPPDITLEEYARAWIDMEPHVGHLQEYASDKRTIVEFGLRGAVSTWAMLDAMPEDGYLIGVDIDPDAPIPPRVRNDRRFRFVVADTATAKLPKHADMVMIDASHEFAPTVVELVRAASLGPSVICCHDYCYQHTPQVRAAIDGYVGPGYLRDEPYRLERVHESPWGLAVLVPR